jgi:hypothetical protein
VSDYDLRYQVFVSSTFRDLEHERQKVLQAILEIKAFPAGMELFPSADDDQFDFIKREIASSDYYVVIVAGKYGSLASDGTSFTEKEYEFAVQLGKPIMGFLYHELGELKGNQLEEEPNVRAKLMGFRDKVKSGKLVKFYRNPDELKAQVWHALSHAFKLKPGQGWVRATNASRLEDLKLIASLQQRLMELEAENASLRKEADPAEQLARGAETAKFFLKVYYTVDGIARDEPIEVDLTWDELLVASFEHEYPAALLRNIYDGLRGLIGKKVSPRMEHTSRWVVKDDSLEYLFDCAKRQFLALSYIDVTSGSVERWILTREGMVQLALLSGAARVSDVGSKAPKL